MRIVDGDGFDARRSIVNQKSSITNESTITNRKIKD